MKLITTTVAAFFALGTMATADGHMPGNSGAAKGMAEALKGGGGGNNSPLKEALGLEGNGGVASFVSGGGNGGWGNVGSGLLPSGQVSNRSAGD